MNQAGLRLEQAPPIWVPFLFFLVAPAFLLLAAIVIAWGGESAMASRHSIPVLGATHLYALGFMAMVMIGSMMQMLPVLQGSPVPAPRITAGLTFAGLLAGSLAFPSGLMFGQEFALKSGAVMLAGGFSLFLLAITVCLVRAPNQNHAVRAMWLAVLSLGATVALGLALALLFGWGTALPNESIHSLHPGWSIFGWIGLLIVGVGFELVPMLQMTPLYPKLVSRVLGPAVVLLLLAWSVSLWIDAGAWGVAAKVCAAGLALAYMTFAFITLGVQRRRRRRLPDVTLNFWRVAMGSLIVACVVWTLRINVPSAWSEQIDMLTGVLALFGFAGFVISGMLYKIMPFLAWFHLQAMCPPGVLAPNMKKILPDGHQRTQFRVQVAAMLLLGAAPFWPSALVYPAALALAVAALLLQRNMVMIVQAFTESAGRMGLRAAPKQA